MSFLKHILPAFNDPSTRNEPPSPDQSNTQVASFDEQHPRLTLQSIRDVLYDAEDISDCYKPESGRSATHMIDEPDLDVSLDANTVEDVLRATRDFLDAEISSEQANVDTTPEFRFEKIVFHPKGNNLPEFSTAQELSDFGSASDLTIPVKNLGMLVDENMMNRIREGHGPRLFKPEDLIEGLRLEPRPGSNLEDLPYFAETYNELLDVLRAWNARVSTNSDAVHTREQLLGALEARCELIDDVEQGYQNDKMLEQQSIYLRQALHSYRPELNGFQDQDIVHQLIMVTANQGIANPDLDDQIRDRVIATLFREYRSKIFLGEEHSTRRDRLAAETERAKLQGDETELQELAKQRKQLDKESCNQASEEVRTILRTTRRHLWNMVLEDLQCLTEQQAGQKWAACSVKKAPASALVQNCIEKEASIHSMLQDWDLNIGNTLRIGTERLHKLNRLGSDSSNLAKKLAGLDVPKAERRATMERRRNDHRTPYIMMDVANQSSRLQGMSQRVVKHMEELDNSLECIVNALRASYRAHDTLLARIDEDDLFCLGETLYVVREPHEVEVEWDVRGGIEEDGAMADKESGPAK